MRPQVKLILGACNTNEDFKSLTNRLLALEPFTPLQKDELAWAQLLFKVWLLKLSAKETN